MLCQRGRLRHNDGNLKKSGERQSWYIRTRECQFRTASSCAFQVFNSCFDLKNQIDQVFVFIASAEPLGGQRDDNGPA